jgi:LCP family protein required for cell wall assembly
MGRRRTVQAMRRLLTATIAVGVCVGLLGVGGARLIPQPQREQLSALSETLIGPSIVSDVLGVDAAAGVQDQLPEPPAAPDPRIVNLLVLGSDVRSGEGNTAYGNTPGQRSDSAMVVQLNPYLNTTTVVSIPRDLWVRMPACAGGQRAKFNSAYSLGGLNCTVRLVREMTGLYLHHVAVLDFQAFKSAVDALGGVQVCLTRAVKDRYADLDLPKGVSTLSGEQALAFARSRHSTATGSDLSRIDRQQYLLTRLLAAARAQGTNPFTAYALVSGVEPYLTVDEHFSVWDMAYLALDVAGSRLTASTLPWKVSPSVPWGSVGIDWARARPVLEALQNPAVAAAAPAAPSPSAPGSTPSASPAPSPAGSSSPSPKVPCVS